MLYVLRLRHLEGRIETRQCQPSPAVNVRLVAESCSLLAAHLSFNYRVTGLQTNASPLSPQSLTCHIAGISDSSSALRPNRAYCRLTAAEQQQRPHSNKMYVCCTAFPIDFVYSRSTLPTTAVLTFFTRLPRPEMDCEMLLRVVCFLCLCVGTGDWVTH